MAAPMRRMLNSITTVRDWRKTLRASSFFPAPMSCATCTENPIAADMQIPPMSHVEVLTRPIAAVASLPRLPTMAASMYCMTVEVISASIAGILSSRTLLARCRKSVFSVTISFIRCLLCNCSQLLPTIMNYTTNPAVNQSH